MQVLIQSASLYVLLNRLNGDSGALFLPKAGHAFLIVAALQCFLLTSSKGRYKQWTQGPRDPQETINPRIRILL